MGHEYSIDLANDDYENYVIYDALAGNYLINSPVFYNIQEAEKYILTLIERKVYVDHFKTY